MENAKRILKDCVGALENLDKAHVFKLNNAYILMFCRDVKSNLKDYVGALEDFDKADVFEPNNAFTLMFHGGVKSNLGGLYWSLRRL